MTMRYKFYREHKYVSFALNDLERRIAKLNFRSLNDIEKIKNDFLLLLEMLKAHAQYENNSIHELLKKKQSLLYEHIEAEHKKYDEDLDTLSLMIVAIMNEQNEDNRVEQGYIFYLEYRKFVGENLLHLHEEETVLLPALQRLYSDEELRSPAASVYRVMTPAQIISMVEGLFPHMNPDDREAFLVNIKKSQPEKFTETWTAIKSSFDVDERINLTIKFGLENL